MRQIIFDTETTGLEVSKGHRIIEIGCVELLERRPTGRTFHRYFNPDRAIDEGAQAVHGISNDFLADKPRFFDVIEEFLAFVAHAELIAHNAAFDVSFLNHEFALAGSHYGRLIDHAHILDTLALAREKYPGQKNSLDALCKRLGIDNSHRELHGALLDAHLLAEVYLAMTAGQGDLGFADRPKDAPMNKPAVLSITTMEVRVKYADAQELIAHTARLETIDKASKGRCLWKQ